MVDINLLTHLEALDALPKVLARHEGGGLGEGRRDEMER
jgi:hypothetical protein